MSVVLHRKHFVVDKKPFFQHFYPKDLAITAARSVVIQGLNVVNEYISTMDLSDHENSDDSDKDDVDERTIFELPAARDFYVSCTKLFVKSLSISTCLRCAEVTCIRIFSVPTVSKLIKDVGRSAVRKYSRTGSRSSTAILMVKTGMWASVLSHIAIFIVEEVTQIAQILYRRYRLRVLDSSTSYSPLYKNRNEMDFFLRITYKNATRCALSIVTSGTAAAIGSYLRPGKGTIIGATMGDSIAYAL